MALLEVRNLRTHFFLPEGVLRAVDGVTFTLAEGEVLGIVGESGCGKSVTIRSILGLVPPRARIVEGQVIFQGDDIVKKTKKEMEKLLGKYIAWIPQDPMSSLNPVFTIGNQLAEPAIIHQKLSGRLLFERCADALEQVKIHNPKKQLRRYPHQLSGGMKQRVVAAMATICRPLLLLADEPTTSLDVTTQAQFLNLLGKMQEESSFAIILVTHDFGIIARVCNRVAVMYAGKIIEQGSVRQIYYKRCHPYTRALLRAVPSIDDENKELCVLLGEPPNLIYPPPGCRFFDRCEYRQPKCRVEEPPIVEVDVGHRVNCWLVSDS